MKKYYENKFTMLKTIEAYLNDNQETVAVIPQLNEHFNMLKSLCEQIYSRDEEKRTVKMGKSSRKSHEKSEVIKKALAVSGAMYAFAKKENMIELAHNADIYLSSLQRLRDTELTGVLITIKELAGQYLPSLNAYGITEERYNSFSEKIRNYEAAVSQSEISGTLRTGAVSSLTSLFEESKTLLLSLDRLINGLSEDNPEFVRNYYNARAIKNLGIRHKKTETSSTVTLPEITSS